GGTFRYSSTNPRASQDPHRSTASAHFSNYGMAYSSLLRFKMDTSVGADQIIIAPDLVEKWESPSPTTWVFTLQKGIKWHNIPPVNGREFTADDVVYSINRLRSPGLPQGSYWQDLDKVEAVDKYTVKFTLKSPSAPFLTIAAFGFNKMVAKEAVDSVPNGDLVNGPLIGTGAWLPDCKVDVECAFKRNPDYFLKDADGNKLPYLDSYRNIIMPDIQARLAAFRAKQLDYYPLVAEEVGIVKKAHPEVIMDKVRGFAASLVHIRNDKAPWNDVRVRTALSKAINRQDIIDTIWGGDGWHSLGWANPGADWFLSQDEFKKAWTQDVEGAKKLLAEAGYPNGIDVSFWAAQYSQGDVALAELLTAQAAKAGIRIKIKLNDPPAYNSQVYTRNGQFEDLAGFAQGTPMDPDLWLSDFYHSKGGRNSSYVNDPKLDEMIEAQRREFDANKRKQIVIDIQRYLLEKNYSLTLRTAIANNARWPWLKNVVYSAAGDYPAQRQWEYVWIDAKMRKDMGAPD
ncbi:MAG: ABC transporter substrate-binding protein, partial [Chloroflexi bacterium]|nr:ABC transporter substrate-binding protein [Chloroflexota bacterium]